MDANFLALDIPNIDSLLWISLILIPDAARPREEDNREAEGLVSIRFYEFDMIFIFSTTASLHQGTELQLVYIT